MKDLRLTLVDRKEKTEENNTKYEREIYEVGNYQVTKDITTYGNGEKWERFSVQSDRTVEYLPDIYFYDDIFKKGKAEFKIQTTSYGSLSPEDIQKVVEGYQEAIEVVKMLEIAFLR